MKKQLILVALAALAGGPAASYARSEQGRAAAPRSQDESVRFQDWAKKELGGLRKDMGKLDDEFSSGRVSASEKQKRKLSELQGRSDELEQRLGRAREEASRDAAQERKEIRERLSKLRRDYRALYEDVRGK